MKRLLILSILSTSLCAQSADKHVDCSSADNVTAQAAALLKVAEKLEEVQCPAPKASDYKSICDSISAKEVVVGPDAEYFEYGYEKRMMKMSCVDVRKMDREEANAQMTKMWDKYKKNFKCDTISFNVPNGNILKFAITQSFPGFLDTLVATYSADINFVDPADNKNVMDYLIAEKEKSIRERGSNHQFTQIIQGYIVQLKGLGAVESSSKEAIASKK